jgi:hypothetical protein
MNHTPFHLHHQHDQTMRQYALPIVHFVAALLRQDATVFQFRRSPTLDTAIANLKQSHTLDHLHACFKALWMQSWPSSPEARATHPTLAFLGLFTLQEKGDFKHPKDVTGIIAKICHAIKLVILQELHKRLTDSSINEREIIADLMLWVKEFELTTFADLMSLQHYATSIALRTLSFPRIVFPNRRDGDFTELLCEGKKATVPQMQEIFANLQQRIITLWDEKIMLGLDCSLSYNVLTDNLPSSEAGYSFLDDPGNGFSKHFSTLADHIAHTPPLFAKFFMELTPGHWIINVHTARTWLQDLAELELLLVLCVETMAGAPIRMSELVSTLIRNRNTRVRNVMGVGKYLTLIRQYSKATNNEQHDRMIPHSLCGFDQDMIIHLHTLARPWAMVSQLGFSLFQIYGIANSLVPLSLVWHMC